MRSAGRLAVAAAVVAGLAMGAAGLIVRPAWAQTVGPRISPAQMTVETPIPPGSRADLPPVVVRNEGTTALDVRMGASSDEPSVAAWTSFDPETFTLAAGEARVVAVRVAVPKDAPLGPQRVRLRATTSTASSTSGLGLGISAGVASVADFTVGWPADGTTPGEPGGAGLTLETGAPAVGLAVLAGLAGYLAMAVFSRFEFQSPLRRKRRE